MSKKNQQLLDLEAENTKLKLGLLDVAAWIFSYSENSVLARNPLFYDLWLRYGYEAAMKAGINCEWRDRRIMFDKVYEEIHKLRGDK